MTSENEYRYSKFRSGCDLRWRAVFGHGSPPPYSGPVAPTAEEMIDFALRDIGISAKQLTARAKATKLRNFMEALLEWPGLARTFALILRRAEEGQV